MDINTEALDYDFLKKMDANEIENMIKKVFNIFIAPDYSEEGVSSFYDFIQKEKMLERVLTQQNKVYIAKHQNEVVGILESRDDNHICLLFVNKDYQRRGIATKLFHLAFETFSKEITVNASPYAVTIYEKLGFVKISGELIKNGITYIPMIRETKKN